MALPTSDKFDGKSHFSWSKWHHYLNPQRQHVEDIGEIPTDEKYVHRDILHRITEKPKDLLRYISPTYGKPTRMVVQATKEAHNHPQGNWRRVNLAGNAPLLLRLNLWVLGQKNGKKGAPTANDILLVVGKAIVAMPINFLILCLPMGDPAPINGNYYGFLGRSWDYPVYSRNPLDARPNAASTVTRMEQGRGVEQRLVSYSIVGEQHRLKRPRKLIVSDGAGWSVVANSDEPYLLVSYTATHWKQDEYGNRPIVERLGAKKASEAGLKAYWVDYICMEQQQPELSEDVHRICDVVRGAHQVCVILPELTDQYLTEWGERMWCLPEGLLTPNPIKFCSPTQEVLKSRINLAASVWKDKEGTRLLAENFTGLLQLGRLELFTIGLEELTKRKTQKLFTPGDQAYALMGLLSHRPRVNPHDTLFQALARLSLANDSDRIVERMICMLPDAERNRHHPDFSLHDALGANLWDIEPICQVAGICKDRELLLDGCRGASIRWKNIPNIVYLRRRAWKRMAVEYGLSSSSVWLLIGTILLATRNTPGGAFLLVVGLACLIAAPWAVIILYGGKVWGQSSWLVGFEGTLPIEEIERLAFGNATGRIRYSPSASLYSQSHPNERLGITPDWIESPTRTQPPNVPQDQRLFTLLDTGSMTVTVFAAARPPSVALIAGREGGMLRVMLCRFERETNCLIKETVVRMESTMIDKASLVGWVKVRG